MLRTSTCQSCKLGPVAWTPSSFLVCHLTMQRVRSYTYIIFCACGPVAVYNRQIVQKPFFFTSAPLADRGVVIQRTKSLSDLACQASDRCAKKKKTPSKRVDRQAGKQQQQQRRWPSTTSPTPSTYACTDEHLVGFSNDD